MTRLGQGSRGRKPPVRPGAYGAPLCWYRVMNTVSGWAVSPTSHTLTNKEQSKEEFTEWVDIVVPHFRA